MSSVEQQLAAIAQRNARVEADKAWETSWTRRLCIAAMTYVIAYVFLWIIKNLNFAVYAFIPTGGYLLSTFSLPWIKQQWLASRKG